MSALGPKLSSTPLRGRDAEWRQLGHRVQTAAAGNGGLVLIRGTAGSGKTCLIHKAMAAAQTCGMAVAVASYDSREPEAPLSPILGALGASSGRSRSLHVHDTRLLLLDQICGLIEERVAHSPLLLVIDDLERVDAANLLLIQRLAVRLAAYPLLWLLALREGGGDWIHERVLAELEGLDAATSIALGPLSPEAVQELVSEVTGAPPGPDVVTLVSPLDGNPLAIIELVGGLRDEGAIAIRDGYSCIAVGPPYGSVEQLIARRLERLSGEARQLLEVAAVLGRSFAIHDVATTLGVPASRLLPALQEARRAGLVVATASEALKFRNHLIHEALYGSLEEPIRLALHRQIGEALLERGGAAREAAAHLIEGARRGDHRVLAALDGAIDEATRVSPEAAARLALRALEMTEASDPARLDRAVTAVEALTAAERPQEAEALARTSLGAGPPPGAPAARLRLALSSLHLIEDRAEDAVAEAATVLEQVDLSSEIRGAAEVALLMGLVVQDDAERARRFAETILAGSDRRDSQGAMATAMMTLARIGWGEGRIASSLGLARAAIKRADRCASAGFHLHPRLSLADMLVALGDFEEADVVLTECHEEIELSEDALYRAGPLIGRAALRLAAGRTADALVDAEKGHRLAERLGTRCFLPRAQQILASVALAHGDLPGAAAYLGLRPEDPNFAAEVIANGGAFVGGQLLQLKDGPAACTGALANVFSDLSSYKRLLLEQPAAAAWLVRTALSAEQHTKAEAVVAAAEHLAADNPTFASPRAAAAHAKGVLERDSAALELAYLEHRHPSARASAFEDAGAVLADRAEGAEARDRFEQALAGFADIGAEHDAARVRARLRQLGIRRRHWSHTDRPAWGWESLTDTETTVAELVSEGLTNPQVAARMYLSRHTVDFHLRQIFRKLAVGSRVELTRQAMDAKTRPSPSAE